MDLPVRPEDPRVLDLEGDGKTDIAVSIRSKDGEQNCSPPGNHAPHWSFFSAAGGLFAPIDDVPNGPERSVGLVCGKQNSDGQRDIGTWHQNLYVADLTGDGHPDVIRQLLVGDPWFDLDNDAVNLVFGVRQNVGGVLQPYKTLYNFSEPAPPPGYSGPVRAAWRSAGQESRATYVADMDGVNRASLLVPDKFEPGAKYSQLSPDYYGQTSGGDSFYSVKSETTLVDKDPTDSTQQIRHLFADLNGDGLPDVVGLTTWGGALYVQMNLGAGGRFGPQRKVDLPNGFRIGQTMGFTNGPFDTLRIDPGVRVADVNGDGMQDLVLMGKGVVDVHDRNWMACPGNESRDHVVFLISTGEGFRTVEPKVTMPIGDIDAGDCNVPGACVCGSRFGYQMSRALDWNGDGLVDLLSITGDKPVLYVQKGKPGLLTRITNGLGAEINIDYKPISDSTVHQRGGGCGGPRHCVDSGMWVVASHSVDNGVSGSPPNTITRKYFGGFMDTEGRGFVGFAQVRTTDANRGTVRDELFNLTRTGTRYLTRGLPYTVFNETNVDGVRTLHDTRKTTYATYSTNGGKTYFVRPDRVEQVAEEGTRGQNKQHLSTTVTKVVFDDYGSVTNEERVTSATPVAPNWPIESITGDRTITARKFDNDPASSRVRMLREERSPTGSSGAPARRGPRRSTTPRPMVCSRRSRSSR